MKTNNQVEVIVFRKKDLSDIKFLMLKRSPQKGGFWQPITGNVKPKETFEEAAVRELHEETGIKNFIRIFDTGYSFEFFDDERLQTEKVFAIEVDNSIKIILSKEHTDFRWASKKECLEKYLKYPGNIEGLKILSKKMEVENE